MTPRRRCSDSAALRLAAAGLPTALWHGARYLYRRALSLIEGQRAWRIQRERIRAELLLMREANRIVEAYAARLNHRTHTD